MLQFCTIHLSIFCRRERFLLSSYLHVKVFLQIWALSYARGWLLKLHYVRAQWKVGSALNLTWIKKNWPRIIQFCSFCLFFYFSFISIAENKLTFCMQLWFIKLALESDVIPKMLFPSVSFPPQNVIKQRTQNIRGENGFCDGNVHEKMAFDCIIK